MIGLSLIPGIVYIVFGYIYNSVIPAVVWYILLSIDSYFGRKLVAEGVETKEQFEFLLDYGCDIFQGHYFNKALPKNKFLAYYTA